MQVCIPFCFLFYCCVWYRGYALAMTEEKISRRKCRKKNIREIHLWDMWCSGHFFSFVHAFFWHSVFLVVDLQVWSRTLRVTSDAAWCLQSVSRTLKRPLSLEIVQTQAKLFLTLIYLLMTKKKRCFFESIWVAMEKHYKLQSTYILVGGQLLTELCKDQML